MWPWGHVGIGYVLYSSLLTIRSRKPEDFPVLVLLVGTLLPDLIDKPLGLWLGVFPEGRALAHSLVFAVPLFAVVWVITRDRMGLETGYGFIFGYLSHLFADGWRSIFSWTPNRLAYLLWPLLPLPNYPKNSFGIHLAELMKSVTDLNAERVLNNPMEPFTGQVVMFLIASILWITHGKPGLETLLVQHRE